MNLPLDGLHLLRALQIASPALPVGAYAYSQGLEWAVDAGWVRDANSLSEWLDEQLTETIATTDLPVLLRIQHAVAAGDAGAIDYWSNWLLAARETRELRADDANRARALLRLAGELRIDLGVCITPQQPLPYATPLALMANSWGLEPAVSLTIYAWGWLENQVLAGIKLVPLGQAAGQRELLALATRIPPLCETALAKTDDELGGSLPRLAIASSLHETQYTRLFRS